MKERSDVAVNGEQGIAPSGKLAPETLEKAVLAYGGAKRKEVLVGPGVGEDAAVIDWPGGKYLVVASDPIVGASSGAGKLLVTVNSNDIASKGADPAFLISTLIFPAGTTPEEVSLVVQEIHEACLDGGISVVGGHTEINEKYDHPVLCATMIGMADRVISAVDVRPGDAVIMTKHVGIEGMCILAGDCRHYIRRCLGEKDVDEVLGWSSLLDVLPESRILRKWASFMHDPTEGGFLGGLGEICRLSGFGIDLDLESIEIHPLTRHCAKCLGFDPLRLISSGVLVAVMPDEHVDEAMVSLEKAGIESAIVGRVTEGPGSVGTYTGEELWRLLEESCRWK
ncbi:MAG TPA: hydrogenase expression protein [Synergistetes bacterium]|nr:hydrogenase expression protein [Synergistota bacterium]